MDNFHFQQNITNEYGKYYLEGIETAKYVAKKSGFNLEYLVFKYKRGPLSVFEVIPKLNAWHPDVIIGPRNSNIFLTIRNSFKKILVLSPYATSNEIKNMPENYYSLTLPDKYMAKVLNIFTHKYYPDRSIFGLIEADCKNCIDISSDFMSIYKESNPDKKIIDRYYLQASVNKLDLAKTLQGYKGNDIILLPNTSYSTAVLMVRITNYLKQPMVYIGADDWGNWHNTEVGKLRANYVYYGIHTIPWSLDAGTSQEKYFIEQYKQVFNHRPSDVASLLSFATVNSIICALKQFGNHHYNNIREAILNSYLTALKSNKNWFRPSTYVFYKSDREGEFPIDKIKISL